MRLVQEGRPEIEGDTDTLPKAFVYCLREEVGEDEAQARFQTCVFTLFSQRTLLRPGAALSLRAFAAFLNCLQSARRLRLMLQLSDASPGASWRKRRLLAHLASPYDQAGTRG